MTDSNNQVFEKIDKLLPFLAAFEKPNRQFIEKWQGHYPVYTDDVTQFVRLAGDSWWLDTGYRPNEAGQMLADDVIIQSASLEQVKTMLTYFVRGERFSDGHWGWLLENGRVQALLRRLQAIRQEYQD